MVSRNLERRHTSLHPHIDPLIEKPGGRHEEPGTAWRQKERKAAVPVGHAAHITG